MQLEGTHDLGSLLESASKGIREYLENARDLGQIDQQSYEQATRNTRPSLEQWL